MAEWMPREQWERLKTGEYAGVIAALRRALDVTDGDGEGTYD